MEDPIIMSIEANIGAGKSTLIGKLQTVLDPKYTTCVQEPVHYWENFRDPITKETILEAFYNDPHKYALTLQTMIYSSLSCILQQAIDANMSNMYRPMIITERSLHSCDQIFTKMLYNSGKINSIEYQVYRNCVAHKKHPLHICIYLKTTPETCLNRIQSRNRQGENNIPLEYLQSCHDAHENWIDSLKKYEKTHVYTVDADSKNPDQILNEILDILSDITHI